MKKLEKEYNAYLESKDNDEIKNKFKVLAEAVSAQIKSAISSDYKLLLVSDDLDDSGLSCVIYYLMTSLDFGYPKATELVKESRISIKPSLP